MKNLSISPKKIKLIHSTISYLDLKHGLIQSDHKAVLTQCFSLKTAICFQEADLYDFIYLEGNNVNTASFEKYVNRVHNDSVMVINKIHHSKGSVQLWNELKHHPKVIVTIEGYNLGFIFFRKEQVEEHFVIRL
ncbi:hypothetical protein [Aquimarina brevivitae]|uniref:hypothetical protein n=1 Tax=Aquimarina brevivitae TaxID=323412 RepID=UPI0013EE9A9A|nr:hypothetical protein [Aquimarina brevivitae]